ncbi:hypothetical protein KIP88_03665 [Bradyrhizobium sp. SRL28]|uniref:hypothetical protein n=1 Tax=Bradyrhizobium sp. SRL28 TaxID=2836178 RepID=UPI001BDDDA03|nr:hypothetical protein [Bradyrhizobium sp. SRL28]MBT1509590.1 hypothetical protein [Bradyrhizobium sp. SRL28]
MTLLIELTAASSNLSSYLATYDTNFSYNGNGWFSRSFSTGQDQWSAGFDTEGVDNNVPSVIMEIDDYSYSPGLFNGDVTSLTLGRNLEYDAGQDKWVQDEELIITNVSGYMPDTTTFAYAIYSLSHGGAVDGLGTFPGLTDYFAEQGTKQVGNLGLDDTLLGFGGQDTFVFQDGSAFDTVNSFNLAVDILDVSAWGATGLGDLFISTIGADTVISSADFTDGITITGVTGLTAANFEFA